MPLRSLLVLLAALLSCSGCFFRESTIAANEAQAIAVIAATERAQLFNLVDQESLLPDLETLYRERKGERLFDALMAARSAGQPFHGYRYHDIVAGPSGAALDNKVRYGLIVVPEVLGESGSKSFLMLIEIDPKSSAQPEAALYHSHTRPAGPWRWPTAGELAGWTRIVRHGPADTLKAAQEDYSQVK